jgi:hypothetical protein
MALLLLMISQSGWSQVSGYAFSQSTGTYTEITGGTVYSTTVATTLDSEVYGNLPIGFTFTYNGVGYTQFGINANGWISMGATTPSSSSAPLSSGTTNNVISALSGDLFGRQFVTASTISGSPTVTMTAGSLLGVSVGDAVTGTGIATGSTVVSISGSTVTLSLNATSTGTGRNIRFHNGTIRYETIGTAPNRQLVVQFKNFSRFATGAPSDFLNFQIVLNETSNRVDLIYNIPYVNAYVRRTLSPKMALTFEGSTLINGIVNTPEKSNPTLGFGFEYFTPKHTFQINLTNSRSLYESGFLTQNPTSTSMNQFCLGFNLIRRW